jgi:putative two-component system response regulator
MTSSCDGAQVKPKTLEDLVDFCVADHSGDGLPNLVRQLVDVLPALLKSQSDEDFQLAVRCARLVSVNTPPVQLLATCVVLLVDVAFAHIPRGLTHDAFPFLDRAIELATSRDYRPQLRKALNAYAAISTDAGIPARGLEYGLRSAALAKELGDQMGVAAALTNVTAALYAMGLYRETVSVCARLVVRFGTDTRCTSFIAAARSNMASAALALQQYEFAGTTAGEACAAMGLPHDAHAVLNRVITENTWLKAAIGLGDDDTVRLRVETIRKLADACKSTRIDLNRELADAAFEIHSGDLVVAVAKLLTLAKRSRTMPGLYRDNLVLLVKAYEKGGDHGGALIYLGELVEFLGKSQVTKVRTLLENIKENVQTPMPGKDDVREMLDNLHISSGVGRSKLEVPQQHYRDALERLAVAAEMREDSFGRHAYRVGKLAGLLAREVGYDDRFADEIDLAARLHDIGKLGIPDGVLMKPDKLSEAEFTVMERHTEIGAQILAQCSHPAFRMAEQIALHHHEKWNGLGYPRKLAGVSIPEVARIAAVADVYDALTHVRPYKHAWTHEESMGYITTQTGQHFEPRLVDAFVTMITRIRAEHGAAVEDYLAEAGNASTFLQARDEMHAMLNDVAPLSEGELL